MIVIIFVNAKEIDFYSEDDYFFKTQLEYPEILYNHHAEIYYEMPQTLYRNG